MKTSLKILFLLLFLGFINTGIHAQACSLLGPLGVDLHDKGLGSDFDTHISGNPDAVKAYSTMVNSNDPGIKAMRLEISTLQKVESLIQNNNLGLDLDGIKEILDAAGAKGQKWDSPDKILDAIKKASDANIEGLSILHQKFPTPGDGKDPFILKNAKQYQKEASGDAGLSFDLNNVSFDDIEINGTLIDRKYGHSSVFNSDGSVKQQSRANSILDQAERQINAAGGDASKVKWEISSTGGASGIEKLFLDNPRGFPGLENLKVDHVAQETIIQ